MRKRIIGLAAIIMTLLAAFVGSNAFASTTIEEAAHGPLAPHVFLRSDICVQDFTNSLQWQVENVAYSFKSGTSTVVPYYRTTNGCGGFSLEQQLKIYLYSAPDNNCWKVQGYTSAYNGVRWSTTYWSVGDPVKIFINTWYYAGCRDTEVLRKNQVGQAMGYAFGLQTYSNCYVNDSVMNECFHTAQGGWAADRNGLWLKYSDRW